MEEAILVVDIGTSKVHTNLISILDGRLLESCARSYDWIHPQKGWSEIDPLHMWEQIKSAVAEINIKSKNRFIIRALAFSYIGDSLLLVDKKGDPIGDMILAFDNRAKKEAQEIIDQFGEDKFTAITGSPIWPEFVISKVLWIKNNRLRDFKKTAFFLNVQQFINMKLGLGTVTDYTLASRKLFLDVKKRVWSEPLCDFLGISIRQLGGDVIASNMIIGSIKCFGEVEFDSEIPVILGAHDSECGMIGLGCIPGSDRILGNITGTYDHIGYLEDHYLRSLEGFIGSYCGPFPNSYVMMGACISGPSLDWYVNTFYPNEGLAAIDKLFDSYQFEGNNHVYLVRGLETGDGCIRGLDLHTTHENLFKAIIEGVTFPLLGVMIQLQKHNKRKFGTLRIGGGGAKSGKWSQLKADMFNIRVEKVSNIEISSVGAAIMAAVSLGCYSNLEAAMSNMIGIQKTFEPNEVISRKYKENYREYLSQTKK
jgi:xylulokinase